MARHEDPQGYACGGLCTRDFEMVFTMAFQPIVDVGTREVFAHEALVRGLAGEGAASVLDRVDATNRYAFDQACRVRAIELAANRKLAGNLSINFLPNAVYQPEACLGSTLAAARRTGFSADRIIFEVTEGERVVDHAHLRAILAEYRRQGFRTAIDDFGAGYSGLNLLAEFQPDYLKLDMELTRGIHGDRVRRTIVRGILDVCAELGIVPIAEGVETADEAAALADLGIGLMQGYLFARPSFERPLLAGEVAFPA
jgi:EAL domain-containing protein (putative c-di-GMP-specific phosphodiesterase class I)